MRDDRQRLEDVLEAIERISRHTDRGRETFEAEELVQTWVVHHIEIIGEAARGLSAEFRDEHSEVPWPALVALRNVLVHRYFGLDLERIWGTVERDLPRLADQIRAILESLQQ